VHEICSETKRTPVWDFGATLYLKKSDPDWEKTALLQFSVHSHQGRGQTECWVQGASLQLGPFFPTNENSKGLVVFESTTGLMVTTDQLAADQEVDLEKFSKHKLPLYHPVNKTLKSGWLVVKIEKEATKGAGSPRSPSPLSPKEETSIQVSIPIDHLQEHEQFTQLDIAPNPGMQL